MLSTLDLNTTDSFLKICRKEIKKKRCQFIGYRYLNINGKNVSAKQALLDIGIMKLQDIWDYILELKKEECIKIERDHDHLRDMNSEIFIFKKIINTKKVYIKLTINSHGVICISFHEDY